MKKAIQALSVVMTLILTISCFTFSGYATDGTDIFITSAPEPTLKVIKNDDGSITVENNGVYSTYYLGGDRVGIRMSNCPVGTRSRAGFDENGTFSPSMDFTNCDFPGSARIDPTGTSSITKTHSFYDNNGDIYFNVVATVSGTWSRTDGAYSVIDNIDLEVSGYAQEFCAPHIDWQSENSFILNFYFMDSLIGSAEFTLSSTGRFYWSFEYV